MYHSTPHPSSSVDSVVILYLPKYEYHNMDITYYTQRVVTTTPHIARCAPQTEQQILSMLGADQGKKRDVL